MVNLSHIPCQQVQLWKLYKYVKKYQSTHNICTKYRQNANITCDEPIKKACHQKINRVLPTCLPMPTYLPIPTYQMARLN